LTSYNRHHHTQVKNVIPSFTPPTPSQKKKKKHNKKYLFKKTAQEEINGEGWQTIAHELSK
jgi:hypothetical protein